MGNQFDQFLKKSSDSWEWHLPDTFNIAQACVTQHVEANNGDKLALIVEDDSSGTQELSYAELESQSAQFANALP